MLTEYGLDDERSTEQIADLQPDDGENDQKRIRQSVSQYERHLSDATRAPP